MKILLIEDDRSTADYVAEGLREDGHEVDPTGSGTAGLELACTHDYDVLVIDRMVPGLDGLSIVRALRSSGREIPVIFLTAVSGIDDRVEALEAGGDDYLVKPFAISELIARVHAIGRRPPSRKEEPVLKVGDLEMNLAAHKVSRAGTPLDLQPREYRLLEYMMRNRGRVLTRTMLLERVWDFHFDPKTNVVESHVSRLRAKLDRPFPAAMIRTVRGSGYILSAPG